MVLAGSSICSAKKWLEDEGVPYPSRSQRVRVRDEWVYQSGQRILRHPVLAGMTKKGEKDVVRGRTVGPRSRGSRRCGTPRPDPGEALLA